MDRIADYEFIQPLGQGNQGSYYLARPPSRLRVAAEYVAVKVMDGTATRHAAQAATRELRAFASVRSDYLVRLFDAGQEGLTFFYSMEYLSTGSLSRPARSLARGDILRAVRDAARAAHDLHEAGLVHRDISPASILLSEDGAKLSDLGLAQIMSPGRTLSHLGPVESIEYLDPAILQGGRPGRSSDIWALGATLHRALAGAGIYGRLSTEDPLLGLRRIMSTAPQVDTSLAAGEASLVQQCLAPIAERFATAKALADAIDEVSVDTTAR